MNGHLGCFYVLATVSISAMNTGVNVFFRIAAFSESMPGSGTARSYDRFIPRFFKESLFSFPQRLYQFTFPPTIQEGSLFFTSSPAITVCRFFDDGHFDWW